jgi:hypothetical protein
MKQYSLIYLILCFMLAVCPAFSENPDTANRIKLGYKIETFGSASRASTTPFWMHNNTRGVVPLDANNIGLLGGVTGFYWSGEFTT